MSGPKLAVAVICASYGMLGCAATAFAQGANTRASVDSNGVEADNDSAYLSRPVVSADGRYVAFDSLAGNLVPSDFNDRLDVFVHDRVTGATVRVSISSSGAETSKDSYRPSISGDGRFVAFQSSATNLVAHDTNQLLDVFVHDRDPDVNGVFDEGNGVTSRVSVKSDGTEGDGNSYSPSISGDGTLVAFASDAANFVSGDGNGVTDVFLHDRTGATTQRVSLTSGGMEADGASHSPTISSDGSIVAFESTARNLDADKDRNDVSDVFVRDLVNPTTDRVSVDSAGQEVAGASHGPAALSSDGAIVGFYSEADTLVAGDGNGVLDVFVRDRTNGVTERASVDSAGVEGNGISHSPVLSADGSIVAFQSYSDNLAAGDANLTSDVFLHDRTTGGTTVVSVNCAGPTGDGMSYWPALSSDGQLVVFGSFAADLVGADANSASDVYVHDRSFVDADATWSNYGAGFPGTNGVPGITSSADPVFGTTIDVDVDNSLGQWTVGFLLLGLDDAALPTNKGGTILVDFFLLAPFPVPPSGATFTGGVPEDPTLCGLSAFLQALEADPGAQYRISFTPGLELIFGH